MDKEKIGLRLKNFLSGKFEDMESAAAYLGTTVGSLRNSYFNGKSIPGGEIIYKLFDLGCNLKWLFTGEIEASELTGVRKEYRVEAIVPAGKGEVVDLTEWYESDVLDYNPADHCFIKVDEEFGYSMMPMINPGDLVLISFSLKPKDGDIVAAKWDKTRGGLKLLRLNSAMPQIVILQSYNQAIEPILLPKREVTMYKVVLIKKKK